jgi:hypothetical protein
MPSLPMDNHSQILQKFTELPGPSKMELIMFLSASMKAEDLEESVHQMKTMIINRKVQEIIKEDPKLATLDPALVRLDPDITKRYEVDLEDVQWMSEKEDFVIGPTGRIFTARFELKKNEIDTPAGKHFCGMVTIRAKYRGLRAQSGTQFNSTGDNRRMLHYFWDPIDEPQHTFIGMKELLHLVWEDLGLPISEDRNEVARSLLKLFWGRWATERIDFIAADDLEPLNMEVEQATIMDIVLQELFETKRWDYRQNKWIVSKGLP